MSLELSSQTGAGSRYGRLGGCTVVGAAGTIGPPRVPKSTLIDDTTDDKSEITSN